MRNVSEVETWISSLSFQNLQCDRGREERYGSTYYFSLEIETRARIGIEYGGAEVTY